MIHFFRSATPASSTRSDASGGIWSVPISPSLRRETSSNSLLLDMTEAGSRQIFHRAKQHVSAERSRFEPSRESHERLLFAFLSAVARGDVDSISSVLAEDVALYGDNAGKGRDATKSPIIGQRAVARFFLAKVPSSRPDIEITDVNGWPAVVGRVDGVVTFVLNLETDGTKIVAIRSAMSAEKLNLRQVS
jgi:RNA polymerase sigma-70 factor, ECF subfamily